MHRSRLGNIVIDCKTDDLLSEARFWSAALGYPLPRELDVASDFIQLVTPAGDVQVIVQRVRHEPRAHLDIETDSVDSEVARLERLGATVVSRKSAWVVMQAPNRAQILRRRPLPWWLRPGIERVGLMTSTTL